MLFDICQVFEFALCGFRALNTCNGFEPMATGTYGVARTVSFHGGSSNFK